jgi:hypothetical protein
MGRNGWREENLPSQEIPVRQLLCSIADYIILSLPPGLAIAVTQGQCLV